MEVKEIKEKDIWENFLLNCPEKTFLNSWNWGEFLKKEENKIWRLGVFQGEELIASFLVNKIKARRGTFMFVPHGPNIKNQGLGIKNQILILILQELKRIAKEEKADFIRIAPIWQRNEENSAVFKKLGVMQAPIHMHPEVTWELNILKQEQELMAGMRKTTRYLIKQAEKNKDIKIIKSSDISDIEKFNNLYKETAKRHHFFKFSENYLKNEFSSFSQDHQILVLLGEYKNKIVSGAMVVFWQNAGFYHHGASLFGQKAPVSYLLQWEAIKEAKKRGCLRYNFWGIAPDIKNNSDLVKSKHPWAGLTLFKMGFGGDRKEYVKTQDFPISWKYWPVYLFEKIRSVKRGF